MKNTKYKIGDVANLMGLSRDTLRHYEKRGILTSQREENGYRYYTDQDISHMITILYQRKMNIRLGDMKALQNSENTIDDLTAIMDTRLREEEQSIRMHQQNIARLQLARSDCEDIRCNIGKISLRDFPAAYIIVPRTDLSESIRLWFSYSRQYSGLDMMYTFSEYAWNRGENHTLRMEYKNSQLVLFEHLKEYVDYPIPPDTPRTPCSLLCVSACCACPSLTPGSEDLLPMIDWAERQGFLVSQQFYSTYTTRGRVDGQDSYFLRIYIPVF